MYLLAMIRMGLTEYLRPCRSLVSWFPPHGKQHTIYHARINTTLMIRGPHVKSVELGTPVDENVCDGSSPLCSHFAGIQTRQQKGLKHGQPAPPDRFANRKRPRLVMSSLCERSMHLNCLKRSCSTREASATTPSSPIFMQSKIRGVSKRSASI